MVIHALMVAVCDCGSLGDLLELKWIIKDGLIVEVGRSVLLWIV